MKVIERIGDWRVYRLNGQIVALDNKGQSRKFDSLDAARAMLTSK